MRQELSKIKSKKGIKSRIRIRIRIMMGKNRDGNYGAFSALSASLR